MALVWGGGVALKMGGGVALVWGERGPDLREEAWPWPGEAWPWPRRGGGLALV